MIKRILAYWFLIVAVAFAYRLYTGWRPLELKWVVAALPVSMLLAWALWLRWDWAPERRRRRYQAQREGAAPTDDASSL